MVRSTLLAEEKNRQKCRPDPFVFVSGTRIFIYGSVNDLTIQLIN
jgi:hypothetical protein